MRAIITLVLVAVILLLGWCFIRDREKTKVDGPITTADTTLRRPTPAPDFSGLAENQSRAQLLAYAGSLEFDSLAGASDTLTLGSGILARVDPEIGARSLNSGSLGSGRIVARVTSSSAYPQLAISTGVTYVWVDTVATDTLRAVMISADSAIASVTIRPCSFINHQLSPNGRARAFFIRTSTFINVPCMSGCCVCPKPSANEAALVDSISRAKHQP